VDKPDTGLDKWALFTGVISTVVVIFLAVFIQVLSTLVVFSSFYAAGLLLFHKIWYWEATVS
jgi:hypothetical protein